MKNEEIRNVLVEQGKKRKDTMAVVVSIIPGGGKEDSNYKFALLRHSEGKDLVTISRGKKTLFDGTFEGELLGDSVGTNDGEFDGEFEGELLGELLGDCVGT